MPSRLPEFAFTDQFGRELHERFYDGVAVIVVAGDREGAAGVALWTAALRAVIGDGDTRVLPVADLGGVPRILRRLVGRLLPRDSAHWCALDWNGQLGAPIRGERGPLVAAAYSADRVLRAWASLPLDMVESATLVRLVEGAGTVSTGDS